MTYRKTHGTLLYKSPSSAGTDAVYTRAAVPAFDGTTGMSKKGESPECEYLLALLQQRGDLYRKRSESSRRRVYTGGCSGI